MERYDVLVVGGGAAGMMAAGRAAALGKRVLLLEKNARLGEKLRISGGGRCNILNAEEDEKKLLANYGEAEQFLYSAFAQCGMEDTYAFFEARGLPLTVEARNRAFPASEKAVDVVAMLVAYMNEGGVEVRTRAAVTRVVQKDGKVQEVWVGTERIAANAYIVSTGGVSHPETGSTGEGFSWLRSLGHTVADPTPTIVPLKVREKWVRDISGITIPDMKITFTSTGGKKFSEKGSVLITHFGLSGPLILNAAGRVADMLHEGPVSVSIDMYPQMDLGILDKHIAGVFDLHKNKLLRNVLKEVVPPGTSEALMAMLPSIGPETKVHSVTREERRAIAELLKSLILTVTGLMGYDRAVVADGGVPLTEVDTKTMRSRLLPNLYIVGDLLHINRPTGGYSLQLCWTTGYVAGSSA